MKVTQGPKNAGNLVVGADSLVADGFCLPLPVDGVKQVAPLSATNLFPPDVLNRIMSANGRPVALGGSNVMKEEMSSTTSWQITGAYDKSRRQLTLHGQSGPTFATFVLTFDSKGNVSSVSGGPFREFVHDLVFGLKGSGVFTAEGFIGLKQLIRGMSVPNVDQKNPPIFT